jgi:hypothetical protein
MGHTISRPAVGRAERIYPMLLRKCVVERPVKCTVDDVPDASLTAGELRAMGATDARKQVLDWRRDRLSGILPAEVRQTSASIGRTDLHEVTDTAAAVPSNRQRRRPVS